MDAAETDADSGELHRLRRQLRAQSLVNRQLYAQLDAGNIRVPASGAGTAEGIGKSLNVPRIIEGATWLEELQMNGGGKPFLVQTPTEGAWVIEGNMRRQVHAGMLFAALTHVVGASLKVPDEELQRWSPGPPVEVLDSGTGPAFLLVGGRRLPVRGLPLPYLVAYEDMILFPEGEVLNVAAAVRKAPPTRSSKVRAVLRREGPVRGSVKLARKALRRILR
jgi:hypothetical protein